MPRSIGSLVLVLSSLVACSSSGPSHTQADCDKIASDIRTAAAQRGIPSDGVCTSTNPQIQKDFAQACQSLKDCNADCCK